MTDEQAETIVEGFQNGALDAVDLRCIAQDFGAWLAGCETTLATELRIEARRRLP